MRTQSCSWRSLICLACPRSLWDAHTHGPPQDTSPWLPVGCTHTVSPGTAQGTTPCCYPVAHSPHSARAPRQHPRSHSPGCGREGAASTALQSLGYQAGAERQQEPGAQSPPAVGAHGFALPTALLCGAAALHSPGRFERTQERNAPIGQIIYKYWCHKWPAQAGAGSRVTTGHVLCALPGDAAEGTAVLASAAHRASSQQTSALLLHRDLMIF